MFIPCQESHGKVTPWVGVGWKRRIAPLPQRHEEAGCRLQKKACHGGEAQGWESQSEAQAEDQGCGRDQR